MRDRQEDLWFHSMQAAVEELKEIVAALVQEVEREPSDAMRAKFKRIDQNLAAADMGSPGKDPAN